MKTDARNTLFVEWIAEGKGDEMMTMKRRSRGWSSKTGRGRNRGMGEGRCRSRSRSRSRCRGERKRKRRRRMGDEREDVCRGRWKSPLEFLYRTGKVSTLGRDVSLFPFKK